MPYSVMIVDDAAMMRLYIASFLRGLPDFKVVAQAANGKEALEKLAEYLTTKPSGLDGYELWITLRRQQGQDKRLLDELTAFAAADPVNANLGILLARQRAQYGNWTGAEAACLFVHDHADAAVLARGAQRQARTEDDLGGPAADVFGEHVDAFGGEFHAGEHVLRHLRFALG